jgi:hypothetical protein
MIILGNSRFEENQWQVRDNKIVILLPVLRPAHVVFSLAAKIHLDSNLGPAD